MPFAVSNHTVQRILNNPNHVLDIDFEDGDAGLIRTALVDACRCLSMLVDACRCLSMLVDACRRGFRIVFIVGAALAALTFVLSRFLLPQVEPSWPDDEKLKEEGKRNSLNV